MAGLKRPVDGSEERNGKRSKTKEGSASKKSKSAAPVKKSSSSAKKDFKKDSKSSKSDKKPSKKVQKEESSDDDDFDIDDVSDEDIDALDALSDDDAEMKDVSEEEEKPKSDKTSATTEKREALGDQTEALKTHNNSKFQSWLVDRNPQLIAFALTDNSRESHIKQKALQQERKAAKPNADTVARSKKLWEQLRRKSHVPLEQRKKLVKELFEIITNRVRDFVFKHDSVRVIQTALKYGNLEQRKLIAHELKGTYKELAQSRYAKFLVGKLIVHGDDETRDLIIPEFYSHVRRLIRHPEGSWILDDIYRTVATKAQKDRLLREWYGPEFIIFQDENDTTSDLSKIIEAHPEKRGPIMNYLRELINQLVQKKSTAFTMLHDAMLQYFLNTKPGSNEANEFIELLKGDEEGDLVKNLAFTKSGSRLMCLTFAYSNAKDRKLLLRFYRDTVKAMAGDINGHQVILAAYEVIDDTKLSAKAFFPELLNQNESEEARNDELCAQVNDLTARIAVLYPFAGERVKWLLPEVDQKVLEEVREIRKETSKKDPAMRRLELVKTASPTLLEFIAARASTLLETTFGCQFLSEVLFEADGDKTAALAAVAEAAKSHTEALNTAHAGRLFKSLVQGGRFNPATKSIEKVEPALNFHNVLYEQIQDEVMDWATGINPFVIVALAESEDFEKKSELLKTLKKNKKALEQASASGEEKDGKKKPSPTSSGAKLLLSKI
jgi:pumilio family protein 6